MRKKIFIFIGPTISAAEAGKHLDACYLPPAAQGDIISLFRHTPMIIGIIDGFFQHVPSVWHKEILLAIARGIHVVGASSMGALRAAELHCHNMHGVGEIFRLYRDGIMEDDDEVAVSHAPAEFGFKAMSDAMINIRKTLHNARLEGIIRDVTHDKLIRTAKALHYPDRSYNRLLADAERNDIPEKEISDLRLFLKEHKTDQKKLDAIEALKYISALSASSTAPDVNFELSETAHMRRFIDRDRVVSGENNIRITSESLADFARAELNDIEEINRTAALEGLACHFARHLGIAVNENELQEESERFRMMHGLNSTEDTLHWLHVNDMDEEDFARLIEDRVLLLKMEHVLWKKDNRSLLNQLRINGTFQSLVSRIIEREKTLKKEICEDTSPPSRQDLCSFFFSRKSLDIPDDIAQFAAHLGFRDEESFFTEIRKYYLYHNSSKK